MARSVAPVGTLVVVVGGLLAVAALGNGCRQPRDATSVQGDWIVESVAVSEGTPNDLSGRGYEKGMTVTVDGEWLHAVGPNGHGAARSTFAIDPTKEPKEVDVGDVLTAVRRGSAVPLVDAVHGIYKLEEGVLVVAFNPRRLPRPTEFRVADPKKAAPRQPVGAVVVITLKRK